MVTVMKSLSFLHGSPYAKTIYRYCHIFLAVDLVLICLVVYGWYTICGNNFCTVMSRNSKTNILAFGDSMTRGYVQKPRYYPYSKSLQKTLNRLHSRKVFFVVDNAGVNGDTAVGTSKTRLESSLVRKKYEWVIILLGTNDLDDLYDGVVVPVDKVFSSLIELCKLALKQYRMVILGTLTARQCEDDAFFIPVCDSFAINRQLLNEKIRTYVAKSNAMLLLADFDQELNYKTMNNKTRRKYWMDNVHLTESGYEIMAKLIYRKMQPYLPATIQQPQKTRKNFNIKRITSTIY